MTGPPVVAVWPARLAATHARLFAALGEAYDVAFMPGPEVRGACAGHVVAGAAAEAVRSSAGAPVLAFAAERETPGPPGDVRFGADGVPRALRDVTLPGHDPGPALVAAAGDTVLARRAGGPAWVRAAGGGATRVGAAPPHLGPREVLRDALAPARALPLVALVQFLREVTAPAAWVLPPARAALLFDDPNLRRPRYGFIDLRALDAHAAAHGYHAALATIPLDARAAHPAAVAALRAGRVSLVVHGNDHTRRELMRPATRADGLALGASALRRIAALEARTGLRVDRVMTAPHGLCALPTARALGDLGFDALCAIHPFPWSERPDPARPLAGWWPAEFQEGCAVVPRVPLDCATAELALRAYLGQPLVLYGHHGDVRAGLAPLAEAAARVAARGAARWAPIGAIAAGNAATRVAAGVLEVRPFSRRLALVAPAGVGAVSVVGPAAGGGPLTAWSRGGAPAVPFGTALPVRPGEPLALRLHGRTDVDPRGLAARRSSPRAVARRRASEARDRLVPVAAGLRRAI